MVLLPYSVREGLAGFQRAKFAVVTSTSAMAVALVLIGLFGLLSYQGLIVTEWLRQRVGELEIFLEEVDEDMANALYQRAEATLGVDGATYITKDEAREIFLQEFGEGAQVFLDDTFLPASIKVRVEPDYANPDSLNALINEFNSWSRVDEVVFNQPLLVKVQENLRLINTAGFSIGIIVVLAALFLVANTIRLSIYARRLLIRTMKLVGATDTFIRRPFLIEGVLQGILAGIVASVVVWLLYAMLAQYLPQFRITSFFAILFLSIGIVVTGGLLGWAGSIFAVRRFIRNVQLH